jgi:hypothetical protein
MLRARAAKPVPCSVHVVSHHLDGFLRARAAGLLRPAADLEVRLVSRRLAPVFPKDSWTPDAFLVTRFIPFKGFPSFVAVPSSHSTRRLCFTDGLCLLAVAILTKTPSADAPIFRRRPPRQRPRTCSLRSKPNLTDTVEALYQGDDTFQNIPCGPLWSMPPRRTADFKALLYERIR